MVTCLGDFVLRTSAAAGSCAGPGPGPNELSLLDVVDPGGVGVPHREEEPSR
jgi:hypothetical protein